MEEWHYATASDLDASLSERLKRFPREPDMLMYGIRSLLAIMIRLWLKIWHRLSFSGQENLPSGRSFVIVANHASHLDALCLLAALPLKKLHQTFPAAAKDYFFVSLPRAAVATIGVNALPFSRRVSILQSLDLCHKLLAGTTNILILFPEGTRSITGAACSFKPGTGVLLAGFDVPAVPCYIEGAFHALPKGRVFPRPSKIKVHFGRPLNYAQVQGQSKEIFERIAQELENAVIALIPR